MKAAALVTAIGTVVAAYLTRGEWFIAGTICAVGAIACRLMLTPHYGSEGG